MMIQKWQLVAVLGLLSMVIGCGGSGQPTNVAENADAQAMADYEAQMKASEAAMNDSMNTQKPAAGN